MSLEEIISKLGIGKKETIYLSITPGVGLELIQLNLVNKSVKNYAYKPLHYNESLRVLSDLEAFKDAVTELFAELKLNTRCDVVLNIPMVLLGSRELPVLLADEGITEALTSEVEQSYIFKRYEPVVSWIDVTNSGTAGNNENRKLYYSAIQKDIIDNFKAALQELGMNLIDIQLSMISILRALIYSGFLQEQTREGVSWNLMIISSNGYSITSMVGKDIIDFYEEPLAIKSFDGEEVYNAVNASAQIALLGYPASYLVIVSETDLISAELLSSRLNFDGIVSYYENNNYKRDNLLPVSLEVLEETAHKISLEAIGNAVSSEVMLPLEFNFMGGSAGKKENDPDEPIHVVLGNYEFDISQNGARNIALIFATILIVPFLILFLSVPLVGKQKQSQLDEINAKLEQAQSKLKALENEQNRYQDFDVSNEVKRVIANNRTKLMGYIALGESIPKSMWLTYFIASADGKFNIKGKATNVQDVYVFYRNMKEALINTPLRLQKLEMDSKSLDDAVSVDINKNSTYTFELTNMAQSSEDEQPKDTEANVKQNGENSSNSENSESGTDESQMLNKPLLNFGKN